MLSWLPRRYSHTFSMGFSSGAYGGSRRRVMFSGTRSRPPGRCQPAPSQTSTAWACVPTCLLISAKCSVMASWLARGMTMAAPTARAGQMAPNREALWRRQSRTRAGREPRGAHTEDKVPCWPTRASSWNQTSMVLPAASGGRASATRPAKFFICLLCRRVRLRVKGPRLQARHAQAAQQLAHCALVQRHRETRLDLRPQVHAAPPDHAVRLQVRPSQDQALQFPHLLSRQRRRAALVADIAQARNAVCVVAVNPVPQGLPVHAASLGRQGSWLPVQHHRQRQQPAGLLGIGRPRCRRTKPCAVQLRPRDRNRYHATHPEIDYGAYELTFTATWESHRSTSGPVGIIRGLARTIEKPS